MEDGAVPSRGTKLLKEVNVNDSILILDDDEIRHTLFSKKYGSHFVLYHVYTAQEAIKLLQMMSFNYIFLDHDLGGQIYVQSGDGTGYEVALWLMNNKYIELNTNVQVFIHSYNPVGAQNMKNVLPNATLAPGLWLEK